MPYYDTTTASRRDLAEDRDAAATQQAEVAAIFRNTRQPLTPSQVKDLMHTSAPLPSIRRAITDLTTEGLLEKTNIKKPGPFGRPEYCWRLRERNKPMALPFEGSVV